MSKGNAVASIKPDEEWRVESDMNTLMEAKKIQADPKRMAKIKMMAQKKLEMMAAVMGDAAECK